MAKATKIGFLTEYEKGIIKSPSKMEPRYQ